jgi:hypothetical protein
MFSCDHNDLYNSLVVFQYLVQVWCIVSLYACLLILYYRYLDNPLYDNLHDIKVEDLEL